MFQSLPKNLLIASSNLGLDQLPDEVFDLVRIVCLSGAWPAEF
jgi:hypothetical protein